MVDYDDAMYSTVLSADTVSALVRSSRFESRTPVPEEDLQRPFGDPLHLLVVSLKMPGLWWWAS